MQFVEYLKPRAAVNREYSYKKQLTFSISITESCVSYVQMVSWSVLGLNGVQYATVI